MSMPNRYSRNQKERETGENYESEKEGGEMKPQDNTAQGIALEKGATHN